MRGLAVGVLALGAGCGPHEIWTRPHSDLALVEHGRHQHLRIGRRRLPDHDLIAPSSVRKLTSGEWVYAARDGRGWRVYRELQRSPRFRSLGIVETRPAGDDVVFSALDEHGWWLWNHPRRYGPYRALGARSLRFLSDGSVVYTAQRADGWRVYVDGTPRGPAFSSLSALRVRTAAPPLAYIGHLETEAHVVIGTELSPAYEWVQELALAATSSTAVWLAGDLETMSLYVDGHRVLGPEAELGGLRVSDDGRYVAVVQRRHARERLWLNGHLGPAFDSIKDESILLTADGRVGYVGLRSGGARAVLDGELGPTFATIDDLQFQGSWGYVGHARQDEVYMGGRGYPHEAAWDLRLRPDRFIYASFDDGQYWVHTSEGREGPFPPLVPGTLTFGRLGRGYASLVVIQEQLRVLVDGRVEEDYRPTPVLNEILGGSRPIQDPVAPVRSWLADRVEEGTS